MDDIGNVVYVIGVIGYMIYRVFAGKKKENQGQPTTSSSTTTIEDLIKQFTGEEETEFAAEPVTKSIRKKHKGHVHNAEQFLDFDSPKHNTTQYQMSSGESVSHSRVSERLKKAKTESVNHVDNVLEKVSEGVDLRRAIIYQTILEAPYLRHI